MISGEPAMRSPRRNPAIVAQPPTISPKCRRKTANYQEMQVCDLSRPKMSHRKLLLLNYLQEGSLSARMCSGESRQRKAQQVCGLRPYHFCFVGVTGHMASIMEENTTVSA